jgi:hypothetical protein
MNDFLLKDAAKILNINYSTAKTILRIFRIEKRIEKKNAEEEKQLKNLVTKILTSNRGKNERSEILKVEKNVEFVISNSDRKLKIKLNEINDVNKNSPQSDEIDKNLVNSATAEFSNEQVNTINKTDSFKEILKNLMNGVKQNEHKNYSLVLCDFVKVVSFVDDCYKNIKNNQHLINSLIDSFYRINYFLMLTRNKGIMSFLNLGYEGLKNEKAYWEVNK